MSIQWTLIAGYLYFELFVVIIMMSPVFGPQKWNRLFKSRLFLIFQQHAAVYFYVLLGVLCLFLFDAIREIRKYSYNTDFTHLHLNSELKVSVKLFRAQRNFYITGFSIFLAFVIRRLVSMLIIQDELSIKAEKIIREAEATVILAKSTVLTNTIQSNEAKDIIDNHKLLKEQLEMEQKRSKEFEKEAMEWKTKYLQLLFEQTTELVGR